MMGMWKDSSGTFKVYQLLLNQMWLHFAVKNRENVTRNPIIHIIHHKHNSSVNYKCFYIRHSQTPWPPANITAYCSYFLMISIYGFLYIHIKTLIFLA